LLRLFMNMPYHEVALKLHLTEETVRQRVHQARLILDSELKRLKGELPFSFPYPALESQLGESPLWQQIKEETEKILHPREPEIKYELIATQIVRVPLPSGVNEAKPIFLTCKPYRLEMKVKTLQQYIARYPGGWRKRLELAEILYALGQWEQAVKEFERVVAAHPQHLPAWILLGQMLMQMEQEERALLVYKRAISFVNNESSKCYLSGMMELCCRRVDRALAAFARSAQLEPWNELFHRTVALTHLEAHRPVQALQDFETALSINPRDLVSLTHIIELLDSAGQWQKAEEYVHRVLEIYPTDILALRRQVEYRCRRGLVQGEEGKKTCALVRKLNQLSPQMPITAETKKLPCRF
jgi:tetratricopeptide (TPR) repeat protein